MKKIYKTIIPLFLLILAFGMTAFAEESAEPTEMTNEIINSLSSDETVRIELLDPPATFARNEIYTGIVRVTNLSDTEHSVYLDAHIGEPDPGYVFSHEASDFCKFGGKEFPFNCFSIEPGKSIDVNIRYLVPPFLEGDTAILGFTAQFSNGMVRSDRYEIALTGDVIKRPSIGEVNITPENDGRYKVSTDNYDMNGYELVCIQHCYDTMDKRYGDCQYGSFLPLEDYENLQINYAYWTPQEKGVYKITGLIRFRYTKDDFTIMTTINGDSSKTVLFMYDVGFTDVKSTDWYYNNVAYVLGRGFMTGKDETTFAPNENLSRAQFATILWRMEDTPQADYNPDVFPDIADGSFYTSPAMWAHSSGVISGYDDGRFGPSDDITREQMAVMMFRYANYLQLDTSARADLSGLFPDADKVSGFAQEASEWAVAIGLITGDQGHINPQGNATRAQCAAIIQRYMEAYGM